MAEVSAELAEIFRHVFDDEALTITRATRAVDVSGWDSLRHVTLVLHVERAFGVRFSSGEVAMLENAGELQDLIDGKRGVR
jgi:acyl carrier protein